MRYGKIEIYIEIETAYTIRKRESGENEFVRHPLRSNRASNSGTRLLVVTPESPFSF